MKWRRLMERATSSSPPNANRSAAARRRVLFESLENRRLFAADVAEAADVEAVAFDVRSIEEVPLENPEIMMMTFRANAAEDDIALDVDASDVEGSPIMYMTGAVGGDFEEGQVRTLETDDQDVSVTSELVDGALSDEDLIFYSMGEISDTDVEVETTSLEESLAPEDVNGDGSVTALDMLLVINALNSQGFMPSGQLTAQSESSGSENWDINRDGYVTPLDALLLTNFFNNGTSVSDSLAINGSRIRMPDTDSEEIVADENSQDIFAAPLVDSISDDH